MRLAALIHQRLNPTDHRLRAMQDVFLLVLVLRVLYPFYNSPLDHIGSGGVSKRQWTQAGQFLDPAYMSGVDSFFYQAWLAGVRALTGSEPLLIQLYTGLLCAALPLCWYGCARALLPARWAMGAALAIAVMPSLWSMYAYFTSETLLLPLIGLACWFSIRCYQKPCARYYILAGCCWGLAAFTRLVALPPGLGCMLFLLWPMRGRILPVLPVLAMWGALYAAASWHSEKAVGFSAPFGIPQMNAILARSDGVRIRLTFDGKKQWFRSPAVAARPLEPLSGWSISGLRPAPVIDIRSENGRRDWDKAMQQYPPSLEHYLTRQLPHNVMMLLFAPSWPEAWPDLWGGESRFIAWEEQLNEAIRWVWAPLILFVFACAIRSPLPQLPQVFMLLTMGLCLMMALQYTAVFEGRYRKPVEPMLILSAALILQARYGAGKEPDHA